MEIVCDKKFMISCMIGFYVYMKLPLYHGCLETVYINNQTILQFVNLWPKEAIENTSWPSAVKKIDGYLDSRISITSARYVISRYK